MEYYNPNMYYPNVVQPTSAGLWPNAYPFGMQQQQQAIPTVYYQVPSATVPEMMVQQPQQSIPTVYYQPPTMTGPPISTVATSEGNVQQPQENTTTTTKTITTRVLDPTTTTTVVSPVEATPTPQRARNQPRGLRTGSTSTSSDETTTSSESTITPTPEPIKTDHVLPPPLPIHTTTMAPVRRVVHRPYTPSGYYSSDLDYGKRKIYKTDYKYRHYYCCNVCKGRCDLRNRSYSCCEWFYGCPVWALIICGLLFLALLAGFLTLFGLQPTLNPSRQSQTAETRLLNRTQIVYGFYKNCGFQVNATVGTPTTLILCTNTATTTTARIQLSPFYTIISGTTDHSYCQILILFCYVSVLQISKFI